MKTSTITGGTISNEQIRDLHAEAWKTYVTACRALGFSPNSSASFKVGEDEQREARYRCAEILTKRMKEEG